jgi:hypothetical protein
VGTRGPSRGVSGAQRGLRHEGAVQEGERGEGNKREGESCWKSGGGRVRLYTWRRTGLADEVRSDAIPDAAGGEGGHGAAKPEGVIHRFDVLTAGSNADNFICRAYHSVLTIARCVVSVFPDPEGMQATWLH